jgi:hypothetical protein
MPNVVTQTIAVYPVVRKFLAKHYPIAPFALKAANNPFAAYLLNALDSYQCKKEVKDFKKLTATLDVSMTKSQIREYYYAKHFNQQKLVRFNEFVKQTFLQVASREMAARIESGKGLYDKGVYEAARMILDRYDLTEDEMGLDTLVRYYYNQQEALSAQQPAAW